MYCVHTKCTRCVSLLYKALLVSFNMILFVLSVCVYVFLLFLFALSVVPLYFFIVISSVWLGVLLIAKIPLSVSFFCVPSLLINMSYFLLYFILCTRVNIKNRIVSNSG